MNHWKSSLFVAALCIAVGPLARGQAAPADAPRGAPKAPASAPASADRAFLGVYIGSDNDGGGVKVEQVEEGSPAAKAGLQAGDVITALGDRTIGSEQELREVIASHQVGEKLRVTFLREGEKRRTSARLAKAPAEGESVQGNEAPVERKAAEKEKTKRAAPASEPKGQTKVEAGPPAGGSGGGGAFLGVRLEQDAEGHTTVSEVVEGSPAEKAGIKAGDVILSIDADETGSADDVVKLVQSHHAGDRVTVAVERDGAKQKIKVKLGAKDEAAASGSVRGLGGATVAVPNPPAPLEPVQPPQAPAKPAKLRGRVAAPAEADAAGADAVRKEVQQMRAELEKTRREMEELRRKCEEQQRTLDAVKRALGGGGGERESTSTSAPASSPGGDGGAVISIPARSTSTGTTEIAVAPATAAAANGDCCAAAGTATASAGDCCVAGEGTTASGVGQIVLSDGNGEVQTFVVGEGEGQTITQKGGQIYFNGTPLTTKEFVIECEDDEKGSAPKALKLGGQVELKLDDDNLEDFHGQKHVGGHAIQLKPTGKGGEFEVQLSGEGDEKDEDCCEACEGNEKGECCEEEKGEEGDEGGQTIVLQLADDGNGGMRVAHKGALGGWTTKPTKVAMKGAPATAHAFVVKNPGAHAVVVKNPGAHAVAVKTDGGKGSCEGCSCCQGASAPAKIEFKAATGMGAPMGGPAAGMKAPARARSMSVGGMGGAPQMQMPRMRRMAPVPGMPGGAHKVDNGGGMELMQLLHSGGSFTWKCDGPCELKIGPGGVQFHCEGSCEISRAGAPESIVAQPGAPAMFRMIGAGSGSEDSESDDDDDDDDDAPAARTVTQIRVF